MWWKTQNLERPRKDPKGNIWHFRVWHDSINDVYIQRIFFWNDEKTETGIMELSADKVLHISKIKQRMVKILADPEYRKQFYKELYFPIEKHY